MSQEPSDSLGPQSVPEESLVESLEAGVRSVPTLLCLGVNHRTADLDLREDLQRGWSRLEPELQALRSFPGSRWRLHEWALLETCNRFELYAAVEGQQWAFEAWLHSRLGRHGASTDGGAIDPERLGRALYRFLDHAAVLHLFEVASGVDSMVLGESEILGQVRRSARQARERGSLGERLETLFRSAVHAGRRVRYETDIGRQRSTVSSLAVARVEQRLGSGLDRAKVLVVGLGEVGHLTLGAVRRRGVGAVGVVNRTAERARTAADRHGLRWWSLAQLDEALAWADVVFTCAASAEPLLARSSVVAATRDGARPLLLVDLAVPRNVAASCAGLERVEVLALDDLGTEADEAVSRRRAALPRVHEVLARELETFDREGRFPAVEPAIRDLRRWSEELRASELARLRRSLGRTLGEIDEETWRALEEFSRSLTDKLLHHPTTRLRESVAQGSSEEHLRALRKLFGLESQRRRDSASA
jgi:glutamyl-tRNA reductase